MTEAPELGIDPGLLERFRSAGTHIAWIEAKAASRGRRRTSEPASGPKVRTARLNDETARVETVERPRGYQIVTESGPVGALVVLLACAERGVPTRLNPVLAGERAQFPMGAIEAEWGGSPAVGHALSLADLVGLARYALP
ncbi:MAG: hypothetical protein L3K15_02540 [Thermoplasmata archaeon]|nr:hypothetical protein [Thermoplasmata archaeon]